MSLVFNMVGGGGGGIKLTGIAITKAPTKTTLISISITITSGYYSFTNLSHSSSKNKAR